MASANFGEQLRQAREKLQLTLKQVESEIKIRCDLLQEFEDGRFNFDFPQIYRRGFLKTYAEFLGLDGSKLMSQIDFGDGGDGDGRGETHSAAKPPKRQQTTSAAASAGAESDGEWENVDGHEEKRSWWRGVLDGFLEKFRSKKWKAYGAASLLIVVGGFFILRPSRGRDLEWDELLGGDGADVILIGANAPKKLTINALEDVRVLVREKKSKQKIFAGTIKKGSSEELSFRENVQVSYSDGAAISMRRDGDTSPLGPKKSGAGWLEIAY
ncbi:MAG: helix-turn-helix domain-containing protein [Puniceicoccales bacterium]|jgi:transcriptional regulator with XRE-family HTH domain|nr:helix-turn-helix domain-containing protein [Puniceicoccales bacterium]